MVRSIDHRNVRKILIRCPNWVGDLVMATPALKAMRKGFPTSHIAWLVKPYSKKVIETLPYCDEILEYDDKDQAESYYEKKLKTLVSSD